MVRTIVKDIFFLGQKSEPATKSDISVGKALSCRGIKAEMKGTEAQ